MQPSPAKPIADLPEDVGVLQEPVRELLASDQAERQRNTELQERIVSVKRTSLKCPFQAVAVRRAIRFLFFRSWAWRFSWSRLRRTLSGLARAH